MSKKSELVQNPIGSGQIVRIRWPHKARRTAPAFVRQYSVFVAMDECGQVGQTLHVGHDREQFREFLRELPDGSPIAVSLRLWFSRTVDLNSTATWLDNLRVRDSPFAQSNVVGAGGMTGVSGIQRPRNLESEWSPNLFKDGAGVQMASKSNACKCMKVQETCL